MKKKILSFILALFMILPCSFAMTGCKKADPDNSSTGGPSIETPGGGTSENETPGNGGSSGGDSGGDSAQSVSTLYDLRVATYDYSSNTSYKHSPIGAQVVWFPDGKTMVIDPILSTDMDVCMDFELFYADFTNYLKYSNGKHVIDYFVVTNEKNIAINSIFFDMFEIKNYYRPDMEIILEYWDPDFSNIIGSGEYAYICGVPMADVMATNPTHLSGKPREYFENCTDLDSNEEYILEYEYNDSYIVSLCCAAKSGANIIKTTNDLDFSTVLNYKGTEYTYSIDFLVPEAKIEPRDVDLHVLWQNYQNVGKYINTTSYDQSAEFKTILSINYGEFDLLYLDTPTHNVLQSFLTQHNKNKKYDVILGSYYQSSFASNLSNVWSGVLQKYEINGQYPITDLYDKNKIESNYMIVPMYSMDSYTNMLNNGTWADILFFNIPNEQERVLKKTNTIAPYRVKNGDMLLAMVTVKKDGVHSVRLLDNKNTYFDYLRPSVDGVIA